jgi:hypothetical protein
MRRRIGLRFVTNANFVAAEGHLHGTSALRPVNLLSSIVSLAHVFLLSHLWSRWVRCEKQTSDEYRNSALRTPIGFGPLDSQQDFALRGIAVRLRDILRAALYHLCIFRRKGDA